MKYTIYLDVLFLINFGMNAIIVWLTGVICRQSAVWWRYLISSLAGSILFLFISWIPFPHVWMYYIYSYGMIGILMCSLAFCPKSFKEVLKCYGCQLLITFLLGGIMNWLYFSVPMGNWLEKLFGEQGIQLGELFLLVGAAVMILFLLAKEFRQYQTEQNRDYYQVSLYFEDVNIYGTGLVDTGNFLVEPITRRPVVIADADWLKPILTEDYQRLLEYYIEQGRVNYDWIAEKKLIKARWIPYQSVGEAQGELLGIQCRKMILRQNNKCLVRENVIVGVSRTALTGKRQNHMLLHMELVEQEE